MEEEHGDAYHESACVYIWVLATEKVRKRNKFGHRGQGCCEGINTESKDKRKYSRRRGGFVGRVEILLVKIFARLFDRGLERLRWSVCTVVIYIEGLEGADGFASYMHSN